VILGAHIQAWFSRRQRRGAPGGGDGGTPGPGGRAGDWPAEQTTCGAAAAEVGCGARGWSGTGTGRGVRELCLFIPLSCEGIGGGRVIGGDHYQRAPRGVCEQPPRLVMAVHGVHEMTDERRGRGREWLRGIARIPISALVADGT